jgi:hypothetical protein
MTQGLGQQRAEPPWLLSEAAMSLGLGRRSLSFAVAPGQHGSGTGAVFEVQEQVTDLVI